MSIGRLLHEFRPLFRVLDGAPASYGFLNRPFLADPFFASPSSVRPALDLTQEGDDYVVEAELPGVRKENIDISVGDGARSITIQGRTLSRRSDDSPPPTNASQGEGKHMYSIALARSTNADAGAVVSSTTPPNQLTTERLYSGGSSFTRTVWLPHPVDSSKISAKLTDGILTLKAPRMEDKEGVKIKID